MPEIVKVARFVASAIGECQNFLGRGFGKRVCLDDSAIRQIREFLIGPKYRSGLKRKNNLLADCDIHLDTAARGQRPDIPQVERVTVRMRVAILAVERE